MGIFRGGLSGRNFTLREFARIPTGNCSNLSYFLFAESILLVGMLREITADKFSPGWKGVENFPVGGGRGDFLSEKFFTEESPTREILEGEFLAVATVSTREGISGKNFPRKGNLRRKSYKE